MFGSKVIPLNLAYCLSWATNSCSNKGVNAVQKHKLHLHTLFALPVAKQFSANAGSKSES